MGTTDARHNVQPVIRSYTMSKASIVVSPTVSIDQFNFALSRISNSTGQAVENIAMAARFITEQTSYRDQQAAAKKLAKVYAAMMQSINGKTILEKSAMQWVWTQCKKVDVKFKALKSQSESAKKKAKQRAARMTKAAESSDDDDEADEPAKKAKPAPTAISTFRQKLIEKELNLQQEFRGIIPSNKVQDFDRAFAAFIQTIELILV